MARTRKYKTEEEQRRANCDKSKRSYARNKEDINARRREKYALKRSSDLEKIDSKTKKNAAHKATHKNSPQGSTPSRRRRDYQEIQVECMVEQAEKIFLDWRLVINQSARVFLSRLCSDFIRLRFSDDPLFVQRSISAHLASFERIRERLGELHRKVLQLAGTGDSLKRIECYTKPIVDLIVDLEDVAAEMEADGEEFVRKFSKGHLYFQTQEE